MRNIAAASTIVIVLVTGVLRSAQIPATQAQTQINTEMVQLKQSSDLVVKDVGFTGLGEIALTLQNRGDVPINPLTAAARLGGGGSSGPKIQVDLYLNGTLVESVYQQTLGGKDTKVFTVKPVSNIPKCAESRDLKIVVDPHNTIKELHDDNNTTTVTAAARPCPDLAIVSIERNYSGLLKETYTPEVTVINKGNWPSPATQVWGTALTNLPGINGWPELTPTHNIPALAPGQKTHFYIGGSVVSTSSSWVRIILDRYYKIDELDEANNFEWSKKI